MDEYIGIIKMFAGNFSIVNYQLCMGQTLAISTNTALFSILGTTFGGNGSTTFMLPDLRGRVPVGNGQGPGLSPYTLGEVTGSEKQTLTVNQMPMHSHSATLTGAPGILVSDSNASVATPTAGVSIATPGSLNGRSFTSTLGFASSAPNIALAPASATTGTLGAAIGAAGGNSPFSTIQPVLALNFVICVNGLYPSRN
jgi:microcystin-dependent protein